MSTAAEVAALIADLTDEEKPKFSALLANDQSDAIKQARGKIASAAKREGGAKLPELQTKLDEALQRVSDLELEKQELQTKAPELAQKVTELTTKLRDQERAHKDALKQKDEALVNTSREVHVKALAGKLKGKNLVGDYADQQSAPALGKQLRKNEDGSWAVLKPGEDTPYDADFETALDMLADHEIERVRKAAPGLILTNVDSGGGRGSGNGNGANTGKLSVDAIVEQKRRDPRYHNQV